MELQHRKESRLSFKQGVHNSLGVQTIEVRIGLPGADEYNRMASGVDHWNRGTNLECVECIPSLWNVNVGKSSNIDCWIYEYRLLTSGSWWMSGCKWMNKAGMRGGPCRQRCRTWWAQCHRWCAASWLRPARTRSEHDWTSPIDPPRRCPPRLRPRTARGPAHSRGLTTQHTLNSCTSISKVVPWSDLLVRPLSIRHDRIQAFYSQHTTDNKSLLQIFISFLTNQTFGSENPPSKVDFEFDFHMARLDFEHCSRETNMPYSD